MVTRLEIRLDQERRRRLELVAGERGETISQVVRQLIDGAYEETLVERRKEAVSRLLALNGEASPDPGSLSLQLEAAHDPGSLH